MTKSPSLNLNKQEYLQSDIVSRFIDWLNEPERIATIRDQADNYNCHFSKTLLNRSELLASAMVKGKSMRTRIDTLCAVLKEEPEINPCLLFQASFMAVLRR